ncbi:MULTISPECIES: ProQ/FINO family protein [Cobetia]|nr:MULTISPECIES: ProQ/FINO family protein [Cobetia]
MDRLEALYSALENEADTQRQQRDGNRQARAALESENAQLRESLARLEQQVSLAGEADAELAALRSEYAALNEQLSGARQQVQEQQTQLRSLHESLLARDAELHELGEQLRDALQTAQTARISAQAETDQRALADVEAATEQLAVGQASVSPVMSQTTETELTPAPESLQHVSQASQQESSAQQEDSSSENADISHTVEDTASTEDLAPSTTTPPSDTPASSTQPSPQALLKQWYRRYPDTFFKGHTRPLKIGIHVELLENEQWDDKLVRRALAGYVHLPRYLKAVRAGTQRVDLEGQSVGAVTEDEALHARQQLDELTRQQKAREEQAADQRISHKLSELMAKNRP